MYFKELVIFGMSFPLLGFADPKPQEQPPDYNCLPNNLGFYRNGQISLCANGTTCSSSAQGDDPCLINGA